MTVQKIGINTLSTRTNFQKKIAFGSIAGESGEIPSAAKNEYQAIETVYVFAKPKAKTKTEPKEYKAITKVYAFSKGTINTSTKMAGDSLELHERPTFMDELRRLGANLREFGKEFKGLIKRLTKV